MFVILLNCVTLGMYQPCVDEVCNTNRCKILQVSADTFLSVLFCVFACDIDYCTACLRLSFPFFGTRVIWLKRHVFGCICLCWVRREILVVFILSGCWYFENCFSFKYLVCSSSRCLLVICMYLIFSLSPSMCVLFFLKADVSSTLSQRRA